MRCLTRHVVLAAPMLASTTGITGREYWVTILGSVVDAEGSAVPIVRAIGIAFDDAYTFSPSFITDVRVGYEGYTRIVDYVPGNQTWSYAAIPQPSALQFEGIHRGLAARAESGFAPSDGSGLVGDASSHICAVT